MFLLGFVIECCRCHEQQTLKNYKILHQEKISVLIASGEDGYADIDLICKKCGNSIESDNGL